MAQYGEDNTTYFIRKQIFGDSVTIVSGSAPALHDQQKGYPLKIITLVDQIETESDVPEEQLAAFLAEYGTATMKPEYRAEFVQAVEAARDHAGDAADGVHLALRTGSAIVIVIGVSNAAKVAALVR